MKLTSLFGLVGGLLLPLSSFAQLSVSSTLDRSIYLVYETVPFEVVITNYSARPIRLEGKDGKEWLRLVVSKPSGETVASTGVMPDLEPLVIESGQTVGRRFNLTRLFQIGAAGQYRVQAAVTGPSGASFAASAKSFTVANGVPIWETTVGVLVPPRDGDASKEPEEHFRTYRLLQFLSSKEMHMVYLHVEDTKRELIYGVYPLGIYLPFAKPQAKIDKQKNLHVLFQIGSRLFSYVRVNPDAQIVEQFSLTNYLSPPNLITTEEGRVVVSGGERQSPQ